MIWKPKVSYKANCFMCLLTKEAVLAHENLNKRGYKLASRYTLYGEHAETINHIFLHCIWAEQPWRMFICLKGIRWVKLGSIKGVLSSWNKDGNASDQENSGNLSQHAFDVQFGKRETTWVLRMCRTTCRRSKWIA